MSAVVQIGLQSPCQPCGSNTQLSPPKSTARPSSKSLSASPVLSHRVSEIALLPDCVLQQTVPEWVRAGHLPFIATTERAQRSSSLSLGTRPVPGEGRAHEPLDHAPLSSLAMVAIDKPRHLHSAFTDPLVGHANEGFPSLSPPNAPLIHCGTHRRVAYQPVAVPNPFSHSFISVYSEAAPPLGTAATRYPSFSPPQRAIFCRERAFAVHLTKARPSQPPTTGVYMLRELSLHPHPQNRLWLADTAGRDTPISHH